MQRYFLSIRAFCVIAAVLAVALAASGCGDSDTSEASAEITVETGSLSKEQFIERADKMCTQSKAQILKKFQDFLGKTARNPSSKDEEEAAAKAIVETIVVPIYDELIDQLSTVGAPPGDEQEITEFLNTLQETLASTEEEPARALNGLQSPFKPAAKLALDYGLKACATTLA